MSSSAPQHLAIVTGASRGMGLAMALQLLDAGHRLLGISRTASDELQRRGAEQWQRDLADSQPVADELHTWLAAQPADAFASATLINNAGLIPRIAPLEGVPAVQLAQALRAGLEAPMLLSAAFLRATAGWRTPRKVLNISSGLGRRAMASQAAYCAAKAGMDHFTRCMALEQATLPHGAKVVSLAPGVIDTGMQAQLRSADGARFPDLAVFQGLKEKGQLASPQQAAANVLAFLARPDFGAEAVADVRG